MLYTKFHLPRPIFHLPSSKCTRIGERASVSFPDCSEYSSFIWCWKLTLQRIFIIWHLNMVNTGFVMNYSLKLSCDFMFLVFIFMSIQSVFAKCRDRFVYALSHWEMMLQCNVVSHWLGAYTKWTLRMLNSSRPSHIIWHHISWSALVWGRACCLFVTKPLPKPMMTYCQFD